MNYIRVWKDLDIDEIKKHLLLIDDLYGTCANCKQLGLKFTNDKICPSCKTEFKYLATSSTRLEDVKKILNRIKSENLDLILIEKVDYTSASAKDLAKDLFKI